MSAPARAPLDLESVLSTRGKGVTAATVTDPRASSRYISFIYGFPDPASLPNDTVLEATKRALDEHADWALQYGRTTGAPAISEALLAKLERDQGIRATDDNLMITAGSSQAIQLLLDLFIDPGDIVVGRKPILPRLLR